MKHKKTVLLTAAFATCVMAAYFGSQVPAQGTGGGAAATAGTKVGVVNVGVVFSKYDKAKAFKDELQKIVAPYKDKADKWRKEMIQYGDLLKKNDFSQFKKDDLEKAVKDRQRALEDMDIEVRNKIGTQQEQQLVQDRKSVV